MRWEARWVIMGQWITVAAVLALIIIKVVVIAWRSGEFD